MADQRVFVGDLTRKEFRERMEKGIIKAAIVPTAATEQHNEHLEMIHDTLHVTHMAEQAAKRLHPQVVVATPIAIGVSEHWMAHKGTLTVRPEIFCEYVYDVCHSLRRAGIEPSVSKVNMTFVSSHVTSIAPDAASQYSLQDMQSVHFSILLWSTTTFLPSSLRIPCGHAFMQPPWLSHLDWSILTLG